MKFADLIDIEAVRALCESFTALTGAVTAILDLEGTILVATGWQRICTKFHRVNPQTAARCRQSDTILAGGLLRGERYNVYRCQNGLVDVAVPIHVSGEHVANFFTGQFFFEPPDIDYFRRQAKELGFDEQAYLEALAQTPIFTEEQVRSMMDFLSRLSQLIGEMGLARVRLQEANHELQQHRAHLAELVEARTAELSLAKEEAESANRAKSAFLTNMSHELKTPLNVITGMSYLLRHSNLTHQQAHQLDHIDAAGGRLLAMVDAVLDLSKLEAGSLMLDEVTFSPSDVVAQVVAEAGPSADAKQLRITVEMEEALSGQLRGDPLRMHQALFNLVANAIKFTERGDIVIRARIERERSDQVVLRFEVQDTGIGIPPEGTGHLFQLFEQGDNSPTRRFGGVGAGLFITKRLAELMGGTAGVRSTPQVGSTFWLTAALGRPSAAPPPSGRVGDPAHECPTPKTGSQPADSP